ncbi:Clavaminate synthase-like protein [Fomitiporia mediterranea MF3/22]|uniref:Clavaminate synthase-like protein n=1 Tax=Fomitiporia mediterranea (strain MF3/22) TaxID=694068 RepID=UPI0004409689|nr:Clavaminate synthase-like protein [Fomitiporia mediterranea MF3/22]EJD06828.1 Clavaminate synthase-like protein [Fomitiporia mediterranea MF3/22]
MVWAVVQNSVFVFDFLSHLVPISGTASSRSSTTSLANLHDLVSGFTSSKSAILGLQVLTRYLSWDSHERVLQLVGLFELSWFFSDGSWVLLSLVRYKGWIQRTSLGAPNCITSRFTVNMPGLTLPPFPEDIPTHPLLVIDYELIQAGDSEEIEKLWKAARELGFWYLKNHGADKEVEGMFDMGAETMDLPVEEKMKFEQGSEGNSFGYKALGTISTNEYGNPDNVEFINISKDDALAYPEVKNRTYPSTVNAHMLSTITPFVRKSLAVFETIYSVFDKKLDLPDGAHTDYGSLSFLHNRLGGLQVLPPGSPDWHYVRPMPGHAICNIGDALSLLSGGILRSNMHRVVPPPGVQAAYTRWSVVCFSRPCVNAELRALDESELIKETLSNMTSEERAKYNPGVTQGEWYVRRMKNTRLKNRKGPETYFASRGMEHRPNVI